MSNHTEGGSRYRGWVGWTLCALSLAFVFFRMLGVYWMQHSLNPDYGIVVLMARHMAAAVEFPLFFYGQAYMGTLEPMLSALFCTVAGYSTWAVCMGTVVFSLGMIPFVYLLGRNCGSRGSGLLALLFCMAGPGAFFHYTASPRGGYAIMLFATVFLLWALFEFSWRELHGRACHGWAYFCVGVAGGLAWWSHQLVTLALLTGALVYVICLRGRAFRNKGGYIAGGGFLLGSLPLWVWNVRNGWRNFDFAEQAVEVCAFTKGVRRFFTRFEALADFSGETGFVRWFFMAVYVCALLGAVWLWIRYVRANRTGRNTVYLGGVLLYLVVFVVCFGLSDFSGLNTPRYLLPLVPVTGVILGLGVEFFRHKAVRAAWCCVILCLVGWQAGRLSAFRDMKKASDAAQEMSQQLAGYLDRHDVRHVYTFFHATFLNYMLDERFVFMNMAGERYAPYEEALEMADDAAVMNAYGDLNAFLKITGGTDRHGGPDGFQIHHDIRRARREYQEIGAERILSIRDASGNDLKDTLLDRHEATARVSFGESEQAAALTVTFTQPVSLAGLRVLYGPDQYARYWNIAVKTDEHADWQDVISNARLSFFLWSGPRIYYGGLFFRQEAFLDYPRVSQLRLSFPSETTPCGIRIPELQFFEPDDRPFADELDALEDLIVFLRERDADRVYADRWLSNTLSRRLDCEVIRDRRNALREREEVRVQMSPRTVFVVRREDALWNRTVFEHYGVKLKETETGSWVVFYSGDAVWAEPPAGGPCLVWRGFAGLIRP